VSILNTNPDMRVLAWPIESASNPYTSLLYSDMDSGVRIEEFRLRGLLGRYAVWHLHWPESLLNIRNPVKAACKVQGLLTAVDYFRSRGTKIVWTMHNFKAHEARHPSLESWFWRGFIPRLDGAISLSSTALAMAMKTFPQLAGIPTTIIPHGHYRDKYPPTTNNARQALNIPRDAKVLLFFGAIRAYKNVNALVRAFHGLRADDARLHIVGRPNSPHLAASIRAEASLDSRVCLKFEFVKASEVATYLSASDLVVLPYRDVLNSGSALLALSCSRPLLVPDLGAMSELQADFGEEWVQTYTGDLSPQILKRCLEWASLDRLPVCSMPDKYDWNHIRSETVRFYRQVVSGAREVVVDRADRMSTTCRIG
jgi:beta-1,4-mannosyltransferase